MNALDPAENAPSLPRRYDRLVSGDLVVSTGENVVGREHRVSDPFKRGLTVAVTLQGRLAIRIDDRTEIAVEAPSVSLILSDGEHRREQVFAASQRLRYALVHLSPGLVESHFGLPFGAVLEAGKRQSGGLDPVFIPQPADPAIRAVAYQLIVCPIRSATRPLYLAGKSLELVALAVEHCAPEAATPAAIGRLTAGEVERLTSVRLALVSNIADPPPVSRLAASVGLSSRALAQGFLALFGTTIPDFVQEQRLQLAYRMITNSHKTVAETAYAVGYTPAYFSTLFRKRYGLSPSDLAKG